MKLSNYEMCQLAHEKTVNECFNNSIDVEEQDGNEIVYTEQAQELFNAYYDEILNNNN